MSECDCSCFMCGRGRHIGCISIQPCIVPESIIERRDVTNMLLEDLKARRAKYKPIYGEALTTHNGRNVLVDAYQEAMDLCLYLRQEIQERIDAGQMQASEILTTGPSD